MRKQNVHYPKKNWIIIQTCFWCRAGAKPCFRTYHSFYILEIENWRQHHPGKVLYFSSQVNLKHLFDNRSSRQKTSQKDTKDTVLRTASFSYTCSTLNNFESFEQFWITLKFLNNFEQKRASLSDVLGPFWTMPDDRVRLFWTMWREPDEQCPLLIETQKLRGDSTDATLNDFLCA